MAKIAANKFVNSSPFANSSAKSINAFSGAASFKFCGIRHFNLNALQDQQKQLINGKRASALNSVV